MLTLSLSFAGFIKLHIISFSFIGENDNSGQHEISLHKQLFREIQNSYRLNFTEFFGNRIPLQTLAGPIMTHEFSIVEDKARSTCLFTYFAENSVLYLVVGKVTVTPLQSYMTSYFL